MTRSPVGPQTLSGSAENIRNEFGFVTDYKSGVAGYNKLRAEMRNLVNY